MAAPVWNSYAIRPLGFGGVGMLCSWVVAGSPDPADAILEVRAKIAASPVLDADDVAAATVTMGLEPNSEVYAQNLVAGPCVVSWFCRLASGWVAGPTINVDLSPSWASSFDYIKAWAVRLLQQLERESKPLGGAQKLHIRGAFPRDNVPLPSVSVQFEAAPQGQRMLGDVARAKSSTRIEERQPWTVSLNIVLWADTPEIRDELAPWFIRAMQAVSSLAPYNNLAEPTYNLSESEDFSGALLEKPLFLVTGSLAGTMWSSLELPVRNFQGHLTV